MNFLGGQWPSGVRLQDLSPQGLVHFIHGRFKTRSTPLGEKVFSRNVGLDFNDFVFSHVVFLDPQKNLAPLQFIVEGLKLVQLPFDKIEQGLVSVEVDGVNLNLHGRR